ncbi:MAG: diacylglycerol kinase family protein [Phycisphaerales bacterium]
MATSDDVRGVLICANPYSGSGPNRRYVEGLAGALTSKGFEPKLVWDVSERKALLADAALIDEYRCVVVAGGDGSIQAVVNELGEAGRLDVSPASTNIAFATLPMGNENLFARHFGFTRGVDRLASVIEAGRTKQIDLGRVTHDDGGAGALFTLMAGVGFDAEVVHRMDRWRASGGGLRRVRRVSYVPKVVSSLGGYGYPMLKIDADGRELAGAHLFVFNLPRYGGGLVIAPPGSSADDGLLDWVLFERPGRVAMLSAAWAVLRGGHLNRPGVSHGRASRVRVRAEEQVPVQVDGDPAGHVPVDVRIADRQKLELLIT